MPNDPKRAARLAANAIMANPPAPDGDPIPYHRLYQWGELEPPPDVASKKEHDDFDLISVGFREMLKHIVLIELGRYLVSVRGVGLKLLAPNENVPHAEDETYSQIRKAIAKAAKVVRHTRDSELTIEERNQKTNASIRMGALRGAAENAHGQAKLDAAYRSQTIGAAQVSPTVNTHDK